MLHDDECASCVSPPLALPLRVSLVLSLSLVRVEVRFHAAKNSLSAFRVHDEGLKDWVELRHQRVHKVLNGGPSLQHPCHTRTHQGF